MRVFMFLMLITTAFARKEWIYEGTWSKCEDGFKTFHSETIKEMDGYQLPCPPCEGKWSACENGFMTYEVEDESECSVQIRKQQCT